MTKTNIFFQDLKESAQCRIWQAVQNELLAQEIVEPKQENETEEQFEARLQEAIDQHINCRNTAQEFSI
jgi:hypothetical protein